MRFGISIPNNQGIASVRELVAIAVEACAGERPPAVRVAPDHEAHCIRVEARTG